ncbi:MAG: biopolymer transporter ExbD, partial [Thermoguttaceae bacterium]|nr:biopolymer transporter ExbD [Thermoguttaceae bacterium]
MRKKRELITMEPTEPNMTSMIDVVFLLISFFTLVMNFSQAEQHEEIALPKSELAQPPETAPPEMITLQILPDQTIVVGSKRCALEMGDVRASSFSAVLKDEL